MSRRSEYPSEAPRIPARFENGKYYVGSDPWFDCERCNVVFDTVEYAACPGCVAWAKTRRQQLNVALMKSEYGYQFTSIH